uniref:Post-GPI attachment to proteins factor 2 n=1 Tax=Panagrolaimus sp. PS1159 TaxID=55785 RepID=A0AC35GMJ0_9BILA
MQPSQILQITVDYPHPTTNTLTTPESISTTFPSPSTFSTTSSTSNKQLISPSPTLATQKVLPKYIVLFSTNVKWLFLVILSPPLFALFIAFLIGFTIDYGDLVNYEWICGKAFLPSISRIINLPKERLCWNLGALGHLSLRPFLIYFHFKSCFNNAKSQNSIILFLTSIIMVISGFSELLFTAVLTVVGEREDGNLHMLFFIAFISSCIIYFTTVTLSTRLQKNYNLNKNAQKCFKIRLGLLLATIILVPTIGTFFTLYWNYCIKFAYNAFALFEYITVLTIFGFHSVIIFELKNMEISFICPQKKIQ